MLTNQRSRSYVMTDRNEHFPSMPRAAATEYELEEIHECMDGVLDALDRLEALLEQLVAAQT